MKTSSPIFVKKFALAGALALGIATAGAQEVFQVSLATPSDKDARLALGNFWFQVNGNEVDFQAFVIPGVFSADLSPVLTVPGTSIEFSLGDACHYEGPFLYPEHNPFLPYNPPPPTGYDDAGNPYYIVAPGFQIGDVYTGHFTLPDGVLNELLAGEGSITLNSFIGGNVTIATAPEPTSASLGLLAVGGLLATYCSKRIIA